MPPEGSISGYSCQATISLIVAREINQNRLDWWFAQEFYPITNPKTSQPVHIYCRLHESANSRQDNRKTKSMTKSLLRWLETWSKQHPGEESKRDCLHKSIVEAVESGQVRPVLFHLRGITGFAKMPCDDEYIVRGIAVDLEMIHRIVPYQLESERTDEGTTSARSGLE